MTRPTRNTAPRAEIEAPAYRRCAHCGSTPTTRGEDFVVVYTTPYPEAGIRRVTARCRRCGGIVWWDEELRVEGGG